jgi:hypothetical protein
MTRNSEGGIQMALGNLSQLFYDGAMLNGPARPRSTRELATVRAVARERRLVRKRGR